MAGGAGVTLAVMATRRRSKTSRAQRSRGRSGRRTKGRGRVAVRAAWRDDVNEQLAGPPPRRARDPARRRRGHLGARHLLGSGRTVRAGHRARLCSRARWRPVPRTPGRSSIGSLSLVTPRWGVDDEDEDEDRAGRGWRLGIGFVLVGVAAVGLMHVAHGNPHGSIDRLEHAGGVDRRAGGRAAPRRRSARPAR